MKIIVKNALLAAIIGITFMGQGITLKSGVFHEIQCDQQWIKDYKAKQKLERVLTTEEIARLATQEITQVFLAGLAGAFVSVYAILLVSPRARQLLGSLICNR